MAFSEESMCLYEAIQAHTFSVGNATSIIVVNNIDGTTTVNIKMVFKMF
jgi:hypothetical protein